MNKSLKVGFPHNKIFLMLYFIIAITISIVILQPAFNKHDPDTFWHLALGDWMLKNDSIVRTSINSFNEQLNYVPHEVLFQVTISLFYKNFGWLGLHFFSVFWLAILFWGLYKLCYTAMEEFNITEFHPLIHFLLLLDIMFIYFLYMPIRPQMVSGPLILWFFIWILKFRKVPSIRKGVVLGLFSLLVSNFHGGVWPILLIFYGIAIIELIFQRKKNYLIFIYALMFILVGGTLNAGGWKSTSYIFLLLNDSLTKAINVEWQSVNFFEHKLFLFIFILIIYGLIRLKTNNIFHYLVGIVISIFSVLSYKHAFYGLLFCPYIISLGGLPLKNSIFNVEHKIVHIIIGTSLIVFFISGFFKPYKDPVTSYPVEEMEFILKENRNDNDRLKILTDFTASAYVNFKGASILADGRWDPFITDKSQQGKYDLNPIERTMYIFGDSKNIHLLKDEISINNPNYLIFKNDKSIPFMKTIINDISMSLGKPVFEGDYGYVWKLH